MNNRLIALTFVPFSLGKVVHYDSCEKSNIDGDADGEPVTTVIPNNYYSSDRAFELPFES